MMISVLSTSVCLTTRPSFRGRTVSAMKMLITCTSWKPVASFLFSHPPPHLNPHPLSPFPSAIITTQLCHTSPHPNPLPAPPIPTFPVPPLPYPLSHLHPFPTISSPTQQPTHYFPVRTSCQCLTHPYIPNLTHSTLPQHIQTPFLHQSAF